MDRPRLLVLDASVAVKWSLQVGEDHLTEADRLLAAYVAGNVEFVAPDAIFSEVASAISVATQGREPRISVPLGRMAVERFLRVPLRTFPVKELLLPAMDLGLQHGCAIYDAVYLALAQQMGIDFITADRKLFQKIGHLPEVVWLVDYDTSGQAVDDTPID